MAVVGHVWNLQFERKLQGMKKLRFISSLILQTHQKLYVSSLNTELACLLVRKALSEEESCPHSPSSEQLREREEGELELRVSASSSLSQPCFRGLFQMLVSKMRKTSVTNFKNLYFFF